MNSDIVSGAYKQIIDNKILKVCNQIEELQFPEKYTEKRVSQRKKMKELILVILFIIFVLLLSRALPLFS